MAEREGWESTNNVRQAPSNMNRDTSDAESSDNENDAKSMSLDIWNHSSSGISQNSKKRRTEKTGKAEDSPGASPISSEVQGKKPALMRNYAEFADYFTISEEDPSVYTCKSCPKQISAGADEPTRALWVSMKSHMVSTHAKIYTAHLEARRMASGKELRKAQQDKSDKDGIDLIAGNTSIGIHGSSVSDLIQEQYPTFEEKPILSMPAFSEEQKARLHMSMANWLAVDNMSQNSFEKSGYSTFAEALGFDINPQTETIELYQKSLAESICETASKQIAEIVSYGPLATVSIQTGVWSSHDGLQQMGVRVTCLNPITLNDFNIMLPLELALRGSLDAAAEPKLVAETLSKINLSPGSIYTQTSDTAAVALLSGVESSIVSLRCKSHQLALVVKDALGLSNSRNCEFDFNDANPLGPVASDPVVCRFREVAARSAHFGRSATGARALADYQIRRKMISRGFLQWTPTRCTSVYAALLRDVQILADGGTEFLKGYSTQPKSSLTFIPASLIAASDTSIDYGLLILSMLRPLHELTLLLQSDALSLGAAQLKIMIVYAGMCSPKLEMVDSNGARTNVKCSISTLNKQFIDFYDTLKRSFFRHLIDDVDDETVLSLALDPDACLTLKALADVIITSSPQLTSRVRELLQRVDNISSVAVNRMTKVLFRRHAGNAPLPPTLPKDFSTRYVSDDVEDEIGPQDLHEMSITERLARFKNSRLEDRAMPSSSQHNFATLKRLAGIEWRRFEVARDACVAVSAVEFWKKHRVQFANVFHVFLQSQSARASSGNFESVFSVAPDAASAQHRSMSTETLNNIMIIKGANVGVNQISEAARRHMRIHEAAKA